jgi:pantoate--beta-alanine ligase
MIATPVLAPTREELHRALAGRPSTGLRDRVALVPTMGALHDGHASLVRRARAETDGPVVVSIFVNPTQFGPGEDFERYPRTFDADLEVAAAAGADVVFAPSVEEVYPEGAAAAGPVTVDPGPLGDVLEGASRPGHFRGVLTVVAKLFGLVRPDLAVFGEKDYQQLVLIRRMAADLCLGVEVVGAPTQREPDGLARSSRNVYLDPDERARAAVLFRALTAAQQRAAYGVPAARWAAMSVLAEDPDLELDYLAIRGADLVEVEDHPGGREGRALVAARIGSTRLIDNVALVLGAPATREGDS